MRKILLKAGLFAILMAGLSTVQAAVVTPKDNKGQSLSTIDFVGALPCGIDSTTTTAVLCGSAGRGLVYGVIISSVSSTDFLVFRDSATANATSSTATVVYADSDEADEGASTTIIHKFPVPMLFLNGISVNTSANPGSVRSRWTILYRPLTATE